MYRKLLFHIFWLSSLLWQSFAVADQCVLTMGYRTSERLPFINKAPNNDGFYLDLYERAAKRIGCKLRILRAPKKRILRELEFGRVDFYPILNYSEARNGIAHFIPNGLKSRHIGISRQQEKDVTNIEQLLDRNKTLLIAPGSYIDGGIPPQLSTRQPPEMDIKTAIELIIAESGDFFIYDETSIRYYLSANPEPKIKIHESCCKQINPMYLGFSRQSAHFNAEANPEFDLEKPVSPTNQPLILQNKSKAAQLAYTLANMEKKGITRRLFKLYINASPARLATRY